MDENNREELSEIRQLLEETRKQTFFTKLQGISMAVFVCLILIVVVVLLPQAVRCLSDLEMVMLQAQDTLEVVEASLEGIDTMSTEITVMSGTVNGFVADNAETMNEVMQSLNHIDFEGLNKAVKDLQEVVEPLANMMSRFR